MRFRHIPKVELHCHLDGIVDPAMLRELERQGYALPVSSEALAAAYPVRDFQDFWNWFKIAEPIEGDLDRFKPILALHIERLKAQNVIYTEIMVASSEIPRDKVERIEKFREAHEYVNRLGAGQTRVEFLGTFGRNRTPEAVEELADRILTLYEAGLVVGVALSGPEAGYPVRPFQKTFARFREAGLGIEIHAGEWAGPESVWDALEHGFPNRIGHGVSLFQDPRLIERVQAERIHIEMCPTSNLKTGGVDRIEAHPIKQAKDLGLSFSINTDDPGPFECSLESEYELLAQNFGFQESDFELIAENALNARFKRSLERK